MKNFLLFLLLATGLLAQGGGAGQVAVFGPSSGGGGGGGTPGGGTGDWQTNAGGGNFGGQTPATGWVDLFTTPTSANLLTWITNETGTGLLVFGTGPVLTSATATTKFSPTTDDGAPLGDTTHNWSDLFMATGGVLNFANGNWVATHSSGVLTVGTGDLRVTNAGANSASVVTVGGSQTLTGKTLTAPVIATIVSGAGTSTLPTATGTLLSTAAAITVAQGGTGLATLTANNVMLGNGTSTPNFVAPGTSGNVLTSNGTTWTSAASAGSATAVTAASVASGAGVIWQSGGADRTAVASNTLGTIAITTANVTNLALSTALQLFADAAPTTGTAGSTAFDTNAWGTGRGAIQVYDGTANTYVISALASDTPSNGQIPVWNTGGTVTWETQAGGGNVSNTGTPTSGQIAEWTNATTIQGVASNGTGNVVRTTSATLVTPTLGVAATTSLNKWVLTAPTTAATLTAGGDSLTYTFPASTQTIPGLTDAVTFTNKKIQLSASLGTDDTYTSSSEIAGLNAGATIAQWEIVYLGGSSTWLLADANGSGTYPACGMALAAYSSTNPAIVITRGTVRNDAWNWTPGGRLYMSGTPGGLTQTPPATSADKVQDVGFALTADIAYVDFTGVYVTVQ